MHMQNKHVRAYNGLTNSNRFTCDAVFSFISVQRKQGHLGEWGFEKVNIFFTVNYHTNICMGTCCTCWKCINTCTQRKIYNAINKL